MRIAVDVDGTLCTTHGTQYECATPRTDVIARVRELHALGHTIIIYTARGSGSGVDYSQLTTQQMEEWGVPYSEIRQKMHFDILIDDRVLHVDDFMRTGLRAWRMHPDDVMARGTNRQ